MTTTSDAADSNHGIRKIKKLDHQENLPISSVNAVDASLPQNRSSPDDFNYRFGIGAGFAADSGYWTSTFGPSIIMDVLFPNPFAMCLLPEKKS